MFKISIQLLVTLGELYSENNRKSLKYSILTMLGEIKQDVPDAVCDDDYLLLNGGRTSVETTVKFDSIEVSSPVYKMSVINLNIPNYFRICLKLSVICIVIYRIIGKY